MTAAGILDSNAVPVSGAAADCLAAADKPGTPSEAPPVHPQGRTPQDESIFAGNAPDADQSHSATCSHLYCPDGQSDWHSFQPFSEPPQQSTSEQMPQAAA